MSDITDRPAQAGEDKGWIFHFAEAARWAAANPGAYRAAGCARPTASSTVPPPVSWPKPPGCI